VAASARVGRAAFQQRRIERIGVQLYTVRTILEKDFEGTIASVAGLGYKEVEFAGYFNHAPRDVRAILDRHGLTAPSSHIDYATLTTKLSQAIADSQVIGHTFIVMPYLDASLRGPDDQYKRLADTFNHIGETTKKAGIQFAYHNHNFEFAPEPVTGKLPYDILLESCDPDLVKMEMDLAWISATGQDPLVYFARYPGRFPMVHVKGLKTLPKNGAEVPTDDVLPDITEVGSGFIDWKRIFAHADEAGIQHYFVEHDQPASPLDSLRTSYQYLNALRF
jgi:sugar phosphate isomerase/epimerase